MKKLILSVCLLLLALCSLLGPVMASEYPSQLPADISVPSVQYALYDDGFIYEGVYYDLQSNLSVPNIYPYAIYDNCTSVYIFTLDLRTDSLDSTYFELDSFTGVFSPLIRYSRYDKNDDGTLRYIGFTSSTPFRTWVNVDETLSYFKYSRIDIPWKESYNAPAPFISANDGPILYPAPSVNSLQWVTWILVFIAFVLILIFFFRW